MSDDEAIEIASRNGRPIVHVSADTAAGREVITVDFLRDRTRPVVTRAFYGRTAALTPAKVDEAG